MKLYETDYLLKDKNNNYQKFSNGDYIIYSEMEKEREFVYEGDSWIKTTELSRYMQKKLIKQILTNKENK
jgi:hypothetical protein|tara:strand:+ start:473 stop:682 length:210 start_codon:yes stop_codon:yes gene_type:complete